GRGVAGLVRGRPQRVSRRAPRGARPGAAAVLQLRPLRRRATATGRVPQLGGKGDARRLRRRGPGRAALSWDPFEAGGLLPAGRLRLPGAGGRAWSARDTAPGLLPGRSRG